MDSKFKKFAIFILYTWLIYNLYFFAMIPTLILKSNTFSVLVYLVQDLSSFTIFYNIYVFRDLFISSDWWIILIPLICFVVPIYFWFRKQTLFRAWMVALSGFIAGPGYMYVIPSRLGLPSNGIPNFLLFNIVFCLAPDGEFYHEEILP